MHDFIDKNKYVIEKCIDSGGYGWVPMSVATTDKRQQPKISSIATVSPARQSPSWDVTYNFRGQEQRMQITAPPGSTVNDQGEQK